MNLNVGLYSLYIIVIIILGTTNIIGNDNTHFYLLTTFILGYNLVEIYLQRCRGLSFFFLNPAIIGALVTTLISGGGITNFIQMEDGKFNLLEVNNAVLISESWWLKYAMMYNALANVSMWIGYKLNLGTILFSIWSKALGFGRMMGSSIDMKKIVFLMIIAYLIKIYLYSIGLHGRVVSAEYFEAGKGFKLGSQIRILGDLSFLTFIVISCQYFKRKTSVLTFLFWISLILELLFAFLYGARSPILYVFLILFVTKYYVTQKIDPRFLIIIPLVLVFAFTTVLEYKNYTLSSYFARKSNPVAQFQDFIGFREKLKTNQKKAIDANLRFTIVASFNAVANTAMAIRYKDIHGLDESDPSFKGALIRVPIDAFIPKFIQGSYEFPWGMWFKNKVIHLNPKLKYSISITPVGFLYLGGGILFILLGFLLYGVLLKFTHHHLFFGLFGFITFLLFLSELYNFDSVVSGVMVYFLRYFFLYPIFLFILLKK